MRVNDVPAGRTGRPKGMDNFSSKGFLRSVYLDDDSVLLAREAGDGNMSAGIRIALAQWADERAGMCKEACDGVPDAILRAMADGSMPSVKEMLQEISILSKRLSDIHII